MTTRVLAAWGVHLYTASGAVLGFLALEATAIGRYGWAFFLMAVATFIDSTDGTLARRVRVKQVLPHFDGARLDDIVDYLNYVVVPVVLAYHAGLIPHGPIGLTIGSLPLLASGYGFCQIDAKTEDAFFKGFPSYWNVVVFYLYALACPLWFNNAILVLLSVLVFVPIRYLYPSKNPTAQRTTYALGGIWGVCMFVLLAQFPMPSHRLAALSLFFPIYYFAISFHLHFRRR
ncbi:MAG: CDP-alcohol phosphatidyltransferase family protein [Gaiellaceae bacterium]